MSVRERIATPDGKRRYVRTLFATIAHRYDLITVLLSYGQDRRWKRRLVALAKPLAGERACVHPTGTGVISSLLPERLFRAVGLDLTPGMIYLAKTKHASRQGLAFLVGDMLALPFPPQSFDLITTGYGLRNV